MPGAGGLVGADTLIMGSVTEFGRSIGGKTGFLSSTKEQLAKANAAAIGPYGTGLPIGPYRPEYGTDYPRQPVPGGPASPAPPASPGAPSSPAAPTRP